MYFIRLFLIFFVSFFVISCSQTINTSNNLQSYNFRAAISQEGATTPANSSIILNFSQPVKQETITQESVYIVDSNNQKIDSSFTIEKFSLKITPKKNLDIDKKYTLIVTTDLQSVDSIHLSDEVKWEFTTTKYDYDAPSLYKVLPQDNASNIDTNITLILEFSELIDTTSLTTNALTLEDEDGNTIEGSIQAQDSWIWFTPNNSLELDTTYTLSLTETVKDLSKNSFTQEKSWSFHTAKEALDSDGFEKIAEDVTLQKQSYTIYATKENTLYVGAQESFFKISVSKDDETPILKKLKETTNEKLGTIYDIEPLDNGCRDSTDLVLATSNGFAIVDADTLEVTIQQNLDKEYFSAAIGCVQNHTYLYLANRGIDVFDISDTRNIKEVQSIDSRTIIFDVTLKNNKIYTAAYHNGLIVYDLDGNRVYTDNTSARSRSLTIDEDLVVLSNGVGGVVLYKTDDNSVLTQEKNISNVATTVIKSIVTPENIFAITTTRGIAVIDKDEQKVTYQIAHNNRIIDAASDDEFLYTLSLDGVVSVYNLESTNDDGKVVDGYLAQARVYKDCNNNELFDAEIDINATTNQDGYYKLSNTPYSCKDANLIVEGGVDKDTNITFKGSFIAKAKSKNITPLTALVAQNPALEQKLLEEFNLSAIDSDFVEMANKEVMEFALSFTNTLTLVAENIDTNDSNAKLFHSIIKQMAQSLDENISLLKDTQALASTLSQSAFDVLESEGLSFENKELFQPYLEDFFGSIHNSFDENSSVDGKNINEHFQTFLTNIKFSADEPFLIKKFTDDFASVAIEGDYVLVGKPSESEAGVVELYKKTEDSDLEKLLDIQPDDSQDEDYFGLKIVVQNGYFVVTAQNSDAKKESVYLFKINSDTNVTQVAKLTADDSDKENGFGASLALEENTIAVGATKENSVYIFQRKEDDSVSKIAKFTPQDAQSDDLVGFSVALHNSLVCVGAPKTVLDGNTKEGVVYIYDFVQNKQIKKLVSPTALSNGEFGLSVVASKEYVAISAQESVFVWKQGEFDNTLYSLKPQILQKEFGKTLTLEDDKLVVGADKEAFLYRLDTVLARLLFTFTPQSSDDRFGDVIAQNGDVVGVNNYIFTTKPFQKVYFYNPPTAPLKVQEREIENFSYKFEISTPNGAELKYTILGDNADLFEIVNDTLILRRMPDFTNEGFSYDISVQIEDTTSDAVYTKDFSFNVDPKTIFPFLTSKMAFYKHSPYSTYNYDGVAIDGDYMALGAIYDGVGGTVYIYKSYSNGITKKIATLQAQDAQSADRFGESVAIGSEYIVVGAAQGDGVDENNDSVSSGVAYIFKRYSDTNITQIAKIQADDAQDFDQFGKSVAIDGDYIVIGAWKEDTTADEAGSVYIFKIESDNNITQIAKIQADDAEEDDYFGYRVSTEGEYIAISAVYEDTTASNAGSVYIFKRYSDDNISQIAKIQADDAEADDYFGYGVAIDGDYIVVGAPNEDTTADNAGSIYLFKHYSDDNISQIAKIQASDAEENDLFGYSVALDNDYIVTGAINSEVSGKAYLFRRYYDDNISEVAQLQDSGVQAGEFFAMAIAIDRDRVVAGSMNGNYLFDNEPKEQFYFRNYDILKTNYKEQLTPLRFDFDIASPSGVLPYLNFFGADQDDFDLIDTNLSLGFAPDFENPLDENEDNNYSFSFSIEKDGVDVMELNQTIHIEDVYYIQNNKLYADDVEDSDSFGNSVAIDGDYMVVGSPREDDTADDAGSAYIFKKEDNNSFTQIAKLQADDAEANDNFGNAVAISGDYIVIGVPNEDETASNAGSVYIFKHESDSNISQIAKIQADDAESSDYFGKTVAIDGDYIVVGAPNEDTTASNAGSVYVFKHESDDNISQLVKIQADDADSSDYFGDWAVAIDGDYIVVGSVYDDYDDKSNIGSAYLFKRYSDDNISQVTKITADDGEAEDRFGTSLDIEGDYIAIGAIYDDEKYEDTGSVYIFKKDSDDNVEQISKLYADENEEDGRFGSVVALQDKKLFSVMPYFGSRVYSPGVYTFLRQDDDSFVKIAKDEIAYSPASSYFGISGAVFDDIFVVGALLENRTGAVYVFEKDSNQAQ